MEIDEKRTAEIFKAFCDENRVKILKLLLIIQKRIVEIWRVYIHNCGIYFNLLQFKMECLQTNRCTLYISYNNISILCIHRICVIIKIRFHNSPL